MEEVHFGWQTQCIISGRINHSSWWLRVHWLAMTISLSLLVYSWPRSTMAKSWYQRLDLITRHSRNTNTTISNREEREPIQVLGWRSIELVAGVQPAGRSSWQEEDLREPWTATKSGAIHDSLSDRSSPAFVHFEKEAVKLNSFHRFSWTKI